MKHILNISPKDVIVVTSNMTSKNRTTELDRFHPNLEKNLDDQHTARFILATAYAIATGLTLAEAISVCFMEPTWDAAIVSQGYSRHCRQGNVNPKVYSWLLLSKENSVEAKIMETNKMRAKILQVQERKVAES